MDLISHTKRRAAAAAIACAAILMPSAALAAAGHPAAPGATERPAVGPVPRGFAADSVTFVSPREAFVLGTAPCAVAPCTSIVRTLDRGASWRGVPAPVVKLGRPAVAGAAVWGIRFATPLHGFVFGTGLWVTTDGSGHWTQIPGPGGSILSLATIDGQVLALTARCTPATGCARPGTLMRRPLGGGRWSRVTSVSYGRGLLDLIATQARVAAMLDGTHVLITKDGGLSIVRRATPCTRLGVDLAASVAVTSANGLALLCAGQSFSGHEIKDVFVSGDDGLHWHKTAGRPSNNGILGTIGAATPAQLTVTADSFESWLYHSADGGRTWRTARAFADAGLGWADLGFSTTADGVVVHGAVDRDGNPDHRPGQLLLTGNAGASWVLVRF
jgi:photosystem II stability/assembly factor-like uncharacterized protein